jgi:hypothetical protein
LIETGKHSTRNEQASTSLYRNGATTAPAGFANLELSGAFFENRTAKKVSFPNGSPSMFSFFQL